MKTHEVAMFENNLVKDHTLTIGLKKYDLAGATATIDMGAQRKGVTLTRVAALGVFALAAKKDKSRLYITVDLASGEQIIIEGAGSKEVQARNFAAKINHVSSMTFT